MKDFFFQMYVWTAFFLVGGYWLFVAAWLGIGFFYLMFQPIRLIVEGFK